MKKINLSVVIPCYNEEKVLPETIMKLEKFFFKHRDMFAGELIFVNDGSSDTTEKILHSFKETGKNIRVHSYNRNIGKGYAVRRGLMLAKYNNVLLLDADLSVRPEEMLLFATMYNLNSENPFIIQGQRIQMIKQPIHRLFAGKCFELLHKLILNIGVNDTQAPFKLLHNLPEQFVSELKIDGFAYDCELLYKAKRQTIQIWKFDVSYINVEDSRVTIRKTIKMFFDLLRIRFIL